MTVCWSATYRRAHILGTDPIQGIAKAARILHFKAFETRVIPSSETHPSREHLKTLFGTEPGQSGINHHVTEPAGSFLIRTFQQCKCCFFMLQTYVYQRHVKW